VVHCLQKFYQNGYIVLPYLEKYIIYFRFIITDRQQWVKHS
jgi:hypothetical protein